jgi:hypothetical protein
VRGNLVRFSSEARVMIRLVLLLCALAGYSTAAWAADALGEIRKSFTIDGKPIPPEIFSDFGDAIMSDNRPIIVTVDARAAIDSNRYSDPITVTGDWVAQKKPGNPGRRDTETMSYRFIGTTGNGLLVVVASWSGGGSGVFYWLHVVDAAWKPAFDEDGSRYKRVDLSLVRSHVLGDRWQGDVKISGNTLRIVTTARAGGRGGAPVTLQAQRP